MVLVLGYEGDAHLPTGTWQPHAQFFKMPLADSANIKGPSRPTSSGCLSLQIMHKDHSSSYLVRFWLSPGLSKHLFSNVTNISWT